jgi:hypothetical protein
MAVGQSAVNQNPSFDDWPTNQALPTGYTGINGTLARETAVVRTGPFAVKFTVAAGVATYMNQPVSTIGNQEYLTVSADINLQSGDLSSSGVLVRWYSSSGNFDVGVKFADHIPNPETGRWYRVTKTVKRPANFTGTFSSSIVFPMAGFSPFGTITAKTIIFDLIALRPATEGEILAYNAATQASVTDLSAQVAIALSGTSGKIRVGTIAPTASTPGRPGDLWFVQSGTPALITAQYICTAGTGAATGNTWVAQQLTNSVIANLDAGKVTTGLLEAGRLKANSISAEKMLIGSTDNLIPDPTFLGGLGASADGHEWTPSNAGVTIDPTGSRSGGPALRIAAGGYGVTSNAWIPVSEGQVYRFSAWAKSTAAQAGQWAPLAVRWKHANGTETTVAWSVTDAGVAADTWVNMAARANFNGKWTVPAGAVAMKFIVSAYIASNASESAPVWFDSVSCTRAADASLIVDGSITAVKMVAGTITANSGIIATGAITNAMIGDAQITYAKIASVDAGKITVGTLDAARISARTITADKLVVTDMTNLVTNGDFRNGTAAWAAMTGVGITAVTPAGDIPYLQVTTATGNNGDIGNSGYFDVREGDEFWISAEWYAEAANTAWHSIGVGLTCVNAAGQEFAWPRVYVTAAPGTAGTWNELEGRVVIPANTVRARTLITASNIPTTGAGQKYRWRNVQVRRRNNGSLIVDGSITATKLVAGTIAAGSGVIGNLAITDQMLAAGIDAAKITVGYLAAARIAAASITATHINFTTLTGTTVTGMILQTEATASRGVKINSTGIHAYNSSGVETVTISNTGNATFAGIYRTSPDTRRLELGTAFAGRSDAAAIAFFGGWENTPATQHGWLGPSALGGGVPGITMVSPVSNAYPKGAQINLQAQPSSYAAGFIDMLGDVNVYNDLVVVGTTELSGGLTVSYGGLNVSAGGISVAAQGTFSSNVQVNGWLDTAGSLRTHSSNFFDSTALNSFTANAINYTTSTGTPVHINSANGVLSRATSGMKHKRNVKGLRAYLGEPGEVHPSKGYEKANKGKVEAVSGNARGLGRRKILEIEPIAYQDRHEVEMHAQGVEGWEYPPRTWFGWPADEFAKAGWEELVTRDPETGEPDYLHYDRVLPVLAAELADQITALNERIETLERKIA